MSRSTSTNCDFASDALVLAGVWQAQAIRSRFRTPSVSAILGEPRSQLSSIKKLRRLSDVRAADEDSVLNIANHLPAEAAEALLELATGGKPKPRPGPDVQPFEHPDAQRRFRVMENVEELARALEYPWDKWSIFLHPDQRVLIEKEYPGPARLGGSAGTGKSIVAVHRAVHLARNNSDARVLLTTFSDTLANALRTKLRRLISNEPKLAERIDVHAIDAIGIRLYQLRFGKPALASHDIER